MGLRFPLLAACASFACIGASGGGAADDSDKKPPTEIDSVVSTPESGERAKDYWTADRMRKAKPMPNPVLDPKALKVLDPDADPDDDAK